MSACIPALNTSMRDCLFSVLCMHMSSLAFSHQCWLCLGAAWGGWHRESSLRLLVPAWSWLGRAASAWGPPGLPPTGLYRPPRINAISSGSTGLPTAPHTHTHAWYAHMIRGGASSVRHHSCVELNKLVSYLMWRIKIAIALHQTVSVFTVRCHWSKGWLELEVEVGSVWANRRPNSNSY